MAGRMVGGIIKNVQEKRAISPHANTGTYGFPTAQKLQDCCERILDQVSRWIAADGAQWLFGAC